MAQTSPQGATARRTTPPDLDALLESLQVEQRPATGKTAATTNVEPQSGDVTARRVQALIRAFDVLHRQVGAIASQGETISKVAETQARDGKAIAELQRSMRYLRAIVIQQLQAGPVGSNGALPAIQIKLVVGHLVEQLQQAERDVAVLTGWAMLFAGLALGMTIAAGVAVANRLNFALLVFATVAAVAVAVALIFGFLARTARTRAAAARRAMDESTLLRAVGTNPVGEPHQP